MTAHDIWIKPTPDQVIDALSRAQSLIAGGWVQGRAYQLIGGTDHYDINGAIAHASGTIRLSWPVYLSCSPCTSWPPCNHAGIPGEVVPGAWLREAVATAVTIQLPGGYRGGTLAGWNDTRGRTQDEVVRLFQAAIDGVRKVATA